MIDKEVLDLDSGRPLTYRTRMRNPRLIRKSPSGFTLVEMLVVIAVIVLLLALLLPGLQNTEKRMGGIKCANTLRQLHSTVMLYVGESNGFFPRFPRTGDGPATCPRAWWTMDGAGWANWNVGTGWAYIGGNTDQRKYFLQCPVEAWENTTWNNTRNFSYSFNWRFNHPDPTGGAITCDTTTMRLVNIPKPAQRVMILDERQPNDGYYVWNNGHGDDQGSTRHFGKGNYMCVDGHVIQLEPNEVWITPYVAQNLDLWN